MPLLAERMRVVGHDPEDDEITKSLEIWLSDAVGTPRTDTKMISRRALW